MFHFNPQDDGHVSRPSAKPCGMKGPLRLKERHFCSPIPNQPDGKRRRRKCVRCIAMKKRSDSAYPRGKALQKKCTRFFWFFPWFFWFFWFFYRFFWFFWFFYWFFWFFQKVYVIFFQCFTPRAYQCVDCDAGLCFHPCFKIIPRYEILSFGTWSDPFQWRGGGGWNMSWMKLFQIFSSRELTWHSDAVDIFYYFVGLARFFYINYIIFSI